MLFRSISRLYIQILPVYSNRTISLLVKGAMNLPLLYIIYAAVALVETTSDTAVFSVLPSIIPAKELDRANSQITGAQLVIDEFVGPPLGGFLFAVTAALPIGASSFACGVASLAFFLLRGPYRGSEAGAERTSLKIGRASCRERV